MNKEEFDKLNLDEQVSFVNEQLKLGLSQQKVSQIIGRDRSSFKRKALRNGYNFNEDTKQFVKVMPSNEGVIPMKNKEDINEVIPGNTEVMTKKKSKKDVQEIIRQTLVEEYPELGEMVDWYRSSTKPTINNSNEFNLEHEKLQGNIISKSFKTYENVLNEFIEFCKVKKELQKDLLALALVEFMDNHK